MGYLYQHSEAWNAISLRSWWEHSTVNLCHHSSDAQATFYLLYTILPRLFGEMKALKTPIRVTRFVCPFTAETASVIDKLLFSEELWPSNRMSSPQLPVKDKWVMSSLMHFNCSFWNGKNWLQAPFQGALGLLLMPADKSCIHNSSLNAQLMSCWDSTFYYFNIEHQSGKDTCPKSTMNASFVIFFGYLIQPPRLLSFVLTLLPHSGVILLSHFFFDMLSNTDWL